MCRFLAGSTPHVDCLHGGLIASVPLLHFQASSLLCLKFVQRRAEHLSLALGICFLGTDAIDATTSDSAVGPVNHLATNSVSLYVIDPLATNSILMYSPCIS